MIVANEPTSGAKRHSETLCVCARAVELIDNPIAAATSVTTTRINLSPPLAVARGGFSMETQHRRDGSEVKLAAACGIFVLMDGSFSSWVRQTTAIWVKILQKAVGGYLRSLLRCPCVNQDRKSAADSAEIVERENISIVQESRSALTTHHQSVVTLAMQREARWCVKTERAISRTPRKARARLVPTYSTAKGRRWS
jgi:hypothetical protein